MDEETRRTLEYEQQFYGMSSEFFIDSFKKFIMKELTSKISLLVNNVKDKIINQAQNVEKFELGLANMKENLIAEYSKSLNDIFSTNQKEISNILSIPPNVLLKEDLVLCNGVNVDTDNVQKEINDLKETYQSLLYLKHVFLEELLEADLAIACMESFINENKIHLDILPATDMCEQSKLKQLENINKP